MYNIRQIGKYEYTWLKTNDFYRLYSQLTECSLLEDAVFEDWFKKTFDDPNFKLFGVITANQTLVGLGSLYIFTKYYRNKSRCAYVEDLVIDKEHRGQGLAKMILEHMINICQTSGCYKLQLNCIPALTTFYNLTGFKHNTAGMDIRFKNVQRCKCSKV